MRKGLGLLAVLLLIGLPVIMVFFKGNPVKAITAAQGVSITLFQGENFTGRSITLTGTLFDMPKGTDQLGEFDWNDQVQSLVVTGGTWRLYQHGRCNTKLDETPIEAFLVAQKAPDFGWSGVVSARSTGSLEIPVLSAIGLSGDISSVEFISNENLPDWVFQLRK